MYFIAKLLKALHSDSGPWSLAFGIALGMLAGLTPVDRLHMLLVLFIVLFLRVNLSTFLLAWGLFSILAFALDPLMIAIGDGLLSDPTLTATWTAFYATSIGRLSQFYHSLTLGSLVLSLALFVPVLLIARVLVMQYRQRFLAWVEKWHVIQVIKSSRLYQVYQSLGS